MAAVVTVVTVLVALLVTLCARGWIPRNHLVGIRIPSFFASDSTWRLGHRDAQAPVWVAAAASLVVTVTSIAVRGFDGPAAALIDCGILLAGVLVGAVRGARDLRNRTHRP